MTLTERQRSLGKIVAVSVVTGVVSSLAAVAVLRLVGIDMGAAVFGAVAGSVVPIIMIRKGEGQAAQQVVAD